MPQIFDNLTPASRLGADIRATFDNHYERVDVATGYIDLRGWDHLGPSIQTKALPTDGSPVARILVGMIAPSDAAAILAELQDQVQEPAMGAGIPDIGKAIEQRSRLVKHLRTQLMRGLPTQSGLEALQLLKDQLQEGRVQMKVYTRRPLHGKTYILTEGLHQNPSWGYLGSSNLTAAGLSTNLELNIDVPDNDATEKLSHWFEERWADKFSLDITEDIIDLIAESWGDPEQPTPYEVYLKVCHALSQDARDGMGYVLPKSMEDLLLNYQATAVRTLARRIVRRGGTMLGDVVGLGKTLTAVATSLMLQSAEDYTTLILCPKNLVDMWQRHIDAYNMDGARVVPYSMAHKLLPDLKLFKLVICDESHNLRNESTRAYEAVRSYVRRNNSKVLLLTATPYNLAFTDVANQLALYIEEDEDLGIVPSAALAKDPKLADKVDGKTNTLDAFKLSDEADDWRRLMSDHLVRRTRSFVKRTAQRVTETLVDGTTRTRDYLKFSDGTNFFFPTRIPHHLPLAFSSDDPAAKMEDDTTLNAVSSLNLPRYRLADYENRRAPKSPDDSRYLDDIRSGRGNVSGFVRTGLFKRLSSSGHSFILSLERQKARNEIFCYAIENDLPLPLGSFSESFITLGDKDIELEDTAVGTAEQRYSQIRENASKKTKWINSTVFTSSLRADLKADNKTISELLARFGSWDRSTDSKMTRLVELIQQTHPNQKVLIFSEYLDTARYVSESLVAAGVERVGLASGESTDPSEIARRFAPVANRLPGQTLDSVIVPPDSINVLVATDVLSEGQNLQDAHIVVNYDLPWAIIRLIQRAGRVDRVGQQSDEVDVYIFSHDKIDDEINLRTRIKERLNASAEAFGSDEQFFGTEREVKILDDFYNGRMTDDDDELDGEADAVSEAWLVWTKAQQESPDAANRALTLPDLIQSTRSEYANESHGGVTCFVRTEGGTEAFATYNDADGSQSLLTQSEALRSFYAEPTTPARQRRADHFERQAGLVRGPLAIEAASMGNLKGIRKWAWNRFGGSLGSESAQDALGALHARSLTAYATNQLSLARRNRYSDSDVLDLMNRLHSEDRLVIGTTETDEMRIVCSIGVVKAE
ncbi:NgoFVII family restriction endonuclease [Rathayibacter sp. AY1B1]|uniref:helicase-related protein n=1 Tax=unclassified Rathayibacter TaxID=2609250 RepID=UPI000CE76742|nr:MULTISPECIES: helicase-related protein [unclassified Rathayibacter]PPI25288.1 NgoFVII family restriction endonuclease [Rathayibacter sp. AY1B6]PPI34749.1 NgoFVII family restriction endonuclease [Rathayibacter sp. AY1B1]